MANKVINTILNFKDQFSKPIKKTTEQTRLLKKQLKEASNVAANMKKAMVNSFKAIGIGAVGLGVSMYALINKTADAMDEIDKMSERTGISRERLQELKYAAGQTGVEFNSIENGVKTLTKNMGKADEESKRMTQAFADMKININDNNGNLKNSNALFEETITKLADMKDQTQRNILGQKIFGGSFQDMIPLLNQGSKGIKALTDRSRELGLIVAENTVKGYVTFGDTLSDVKQSLGAFGTQIATVVLPYVQKFSDYLLDNIPQLTPIVEGVFNGITDSIIWLKDNMNWLLPIASGLLGTFISFQVVTGISKSILTFKKATEGLTLAQAILNKTMLNNPFVMWTVIIGLLITAGITLWKNWDTIKAKAIELYAGIKTALAPLGQFFSGLWDGMKNGFRSVVNFVVDGLNIMIKGLLAPFNFLVKGLNMLPAVNLPELKLEIPKIPSYATGTSYFRGGLARTDEGGRGEIKEYPNGTKIIPADKSKKIVENMTNNSQPINVNIYGNVYGETDLINKVGYAITKQVKKLIPIV